MPVWKVPLVTAEPTIRLSNWSIREVDGEALHLVGLNVTSREGRVTSAIEFLDLATRRARTQSGRLYELVGSPGFHSDAEYVFGVWCAGYSVKSSRDVTLELLEARGSESA